ncbi:MAG: DUF3102 domain-containing protein [Verrucomicrobiae bacterium]
MKTAMPSCGTPDNEQATRGDPGLSRVRAMCSPGSTTVTPSPKKGQKQSGGGASNLVKLAVEIRSRADQVLDHEKSGRQAGEQAIRHAIEAGKLLRKSKELAGHGKWEPWLAENLTKVSQETACRWMRLANLSCVTDLTEAVSLMDAYRICGILPELGIKKPSEKKATTRKLSSSEAVLRTSSTLQRRLRQIVQGGVKVSGPERDQLKLQWRTLNDLFAKILSEESD